MNMDAILRIVAKVDGGNALQKLGADLAGVGKSAGATVSPFGQMRGALRGVADVAATIGLAAVGTTLLNAGIEAEQSSIRINALAKQYGEVSGVTDVAARAAEQFALGNVEAQNAVTNLYGRLRPMGVSLQDIETVFFGVNKAAKQVGLSTYDTSEVLLQLSQALGSGKLQGDELRSIMERMPAVGQAVAKVMGVSASEIKKLGSEGKITTEVMIQAAAELNKIVPPPPTAMQEFDKALKDLRTELGENLLPILLPFVKGLTSLVTTFGQLPEPIQTATLALAAFAIAAGPIASVITGIGKAMMILGSLKIGAIIAGWAGAIVPAIALIKGALLGLAAWLSGTLLPGLLAFFSGPIGWTVLAVAAVVAMAIAFRKPIMQFFNWLGGRLAEGAAAIGAWALKIPQFMVSAWTAARDAIRSFFAWFAGAITDGMKALWAIGEPIRKFWAGVWDGVRPFVTGFFNFMRDTFSWGLKAAWAVVDTLLIRPWINVWETLIRRPALAAFTWLRANVFQPLSEAFRDVVVTPIQAAWSNLTQTLLSAMSNLVATVRNAWSSLGQAFNQYVVSPVQQSWSTLTASIGQLMQSAVSSIIGAWVALGQGFGQYVAEPIGNAWNAVVQFMPNAMRSVADYVQGVWTGMVESIKAAVLSMLYFIASRINSVAGMVNNLIKGFNALPGADIPLIPTVSIPQFAQGGTVNRPTLAMVGEGGEREYIIPESKMQAASSRFLAGQRGASVIPATRSGGSQPRGRGLQIDITTGPVMQQQDGSRWVSVEDFERGIQRVSERIFDDLRRPETRLAIGSL